MLAAGVILATLGGMEVLWRSEGHRPSVVDDEHLWACERARVYENNPDTIVFLGTSRVLTNVSLDALRRDFPGVVTVQLGVDGKSPAAALVDLADDGRFRGLVVCEMPEHGFERRDRDDQADLVRNYHDRGTLDNRLNRRIASFWQWNFVVVNPQVGIGKLAESWMSGRLVPHPGFVVTTPDRQQLTDYSKTNATENRAFRLRRVLRAYEVNPTPPPDAWFREAMELEPAIERLLGRGARVVIARFPTTGEYWQADEQHYPKADYWDRFAAATRAVTIHFKDVPELDRFECPDMSHIDVKDAPAFTEAFAAQLVARGVLAPRGREGAR